VSGPEPAELSQPVIHLLEWWLNAAVLKFAREYSHLIQIITYGRQYRIEMGCFWAAWAAFCATECATAGILCNSRFEPFGARNRNPTFLAGTIRDPKALLHIADFSTK
jgi:hypothetical protein